MFSLSFLLLSVCVAGFAAILSYLLGIASARWAVRLKAVDNPTGGRKIHTKPIPLFGGVGIALCVLLSLAVLTVDGVILEAGVTARQLIGFVAALLILLIGGMTDDIHSLSPRQQILFPTLAALAVLISGTGIIQVTSLSGDGGMSLGWWKYAPLHLTLPADLITIAWLLLATYATKLLDGLDGLVAGLAVIGSGMVGALTLSSQYFQPGVSLLASIIGGSFLGFLPRNLHPARQFLGETGSTLAGFSLGFLAIVSSAKIAIALAVLAIPLADAIFVVVGRLRRGAPPWKGDDTHLHFRLLQVGIPHRTVVRLLWGASFAAGVLALSLQTRGKLFLVATLVAITALTSWLTNRYALRRPLPKT